VVIFYIAAGIGIVLSVVYLAVGTLSFLRIRRELLSGNDLELSEALRDDKGTSEFSAVDVVPGFAWKATVAVVTSFVALVLVSRARNSLHKCNHRAPGWLLGESGCAVG
jgi:hypothetical protein